MPPPSAQRAARALGTLAAFILVAASCGGGGDEITTTPSAPPTTAADDAYTPAPGSSPLTGLPIAGSPAESSPALVIKLDNAPKARPQVGINLADVVIEEKVEDGVTRFFTVFHTRQGADPIGPVRSARSTDILLAGALNRPLFSYSGTNPVHQKQLDSAPLVDVGIDRQPRLYYRERSRPAPYNLFTRNADLRRHTPQGAGPPPPQFRFRAAGEALAAEGATPNGAVHTEYLGDNIDTFVDWRWDSAARVYKRWMDGPPHTDEKGEQVTAHNVIIQFVEYVDTGIRDTSDTAVPEAKLVGSGEAWVLTDGKVVRGSWAKADLPDVTTFTDAAGRQVRLTPGRTWIELSPLGASRLG